MDSEDKELEERLISLLGHLQAEGGILERVVYKNKNQHRRCSYFRYLLKVRRDFKLLQSAKLEELVNSCFIVINGERPKQKIHLLESLKRRKCDGGEHNFMERLWGAARLLSQMVEPMLKAATEVSILFAQSFFMGFSLTVMSLLARLRVLVQQILLDVVSLFNMISFLSQKKQSVKITQEGVEVFREFYPKHEESVTLECKSAAEVLTQKDGNTELLAGPSTMNDKEKTIEGDKEGGDSLDVVETPCKELSPQEGGVLGLSKSSSGGTALKHKSGSKRVAFLSVKNPTLSTPNVQNLSPLNAKAPHLMENVTDNDNKQDTFFSLLTSGIVKDSLF
ncbi:Calcium-dependent protein kinase 14 [Quillaja saponaria]|uniref:Calcium-dependent protein kinase 14 n=1 Tax=Quillaja saponaria TaxID=32244 RepID=A0AAD7LMN1_QUISA|nr:Calcium-dependent protein kinase 14 [Quillaja saponaria]